ncbi:hybrid sensor histidine kinase/response regulator [Pseudomonas mucidolens]|uniref:histidine kinase n=1 Tax=Pseudomonas mucidolens TaxID=46679 RepID=A0A1H2N8S1_9PSED|nr:hybrid sensor histidine kinase/response regulator [Pseudomonas mucidolens]SDV01913.1 two-component system, NarL family, capsular synthesis sensor histidine kinase RcsC [Pseudomonas mucidolens]SQH32405.1 sensor histidine kinase/response regulator [Pseudomonas mucidolens]
MKQAKVRLGVLALSSLRLNKLLLLLTGLALLLVSMSYWAVNRVLQEESEKTNFHFARLMESIHEHAVFLRSAAESFGKPNEILSLDSKPYSHVELMRQGDERLFQSRNRAKSLPFTVSQRDKFNLNEMQGTYSFGAQLTDLFTAYWSDAYYSAPQVFVFSPTDQFTIAVPGIDGNRQYPVLLKNNFFDVTKRLYDELLAQRHRLKNSQLFWMRGPLGLIQKRRYIVGAIGVDLSSGFVPAPDDGGSVILTALVDVSDINDLERLLMRPTNSRLTLISPTGDVLFGENRDVEVLPLGLSFTRDGLRFKLSSGGTDPWIGLYAISYQQFLGYAKRPLMAATGLLLLFMLIGWRLNRWYRVHIIEPAQRSSQSLAESEEFNRVMLDSAPVGLCVVQRSTETILLENQRAQQWQGTPELIALLKRDYPELVPGEVQLEVAGRHLQACFAFTRYQGEDVVLCGFNDITRRVDDSNMLEQARRSADEANKAKTMFLATMSHEIRTPLYGVLGNLELLELTSLDGRQHEYLQTIQRSSAVLFQLISDVLDVSKIESGQMAVEAKTFSPLDVFEDTVRSYSAAANNKGLKIFACADATLPPLLYGDAVRIRQVINNLLSNAIKFTDSGHITFRLRVTDIEHDHVSLQWQVSDTGIGISEQQLSHLFKPFSQVGNSERTGGAGLGLSICSRLSEMMGANLRVVSEPGLGSSFSLHIRLPTIAGSLANSTDIDLEGMNIFVRAPLKDVEQSLIEWLARWGARAQTLPVSDIENSNAILLDIDPVPVQAREWQGKHVIATESGSSHPLKTVRGWEVNAYDIRAIARALMQVARGTAPEVTDGAPGPVAGMALSALVAEDNPINREILKEQLCTLGVRVTLAEDGEQALLRWGDGSFDLVITDVNMPKLDGYQLTRRLREVDPDVPIIGVTANAMREEGEQCLEAGMTAWLVKPLSLKTLHQTLSDYCPQSQQVDSSTFKTETSALKTDDLEGWITLSPAMHRLFITTMQEDLTRAEQALKASNTSTLVSHLHRMNGSLATVCAVNLAAACNECEIALLHAPLNTVSIRRISMLLERLHTAISRMAEGELLSRQ